MLLHDISSTARTVERVLERVQEPLPSEGIIHSIDGNRVDLRLNHSAGVLRHVEVIGDIANAAVGDAVPLQWKDGRPLALIVGGAGGAYGIGGMPKVVVDNDTIENSEEGLRVKVGGIGLQNLAFIPALEGHTHPDAFTDAGWRTNDDGTIFQGRTFIHPEGQVVLGSGNSIIKLDSLNANYRLWVGNPDPALAPFSISAAGAMIATAGSIAGWDITSSTLSKNQIELDAVNGVINVGNKLGTYIQIDGLNERIRSSNYVGNLAGFNISAATGDAEFNNILARGVLQGMAFQVNYASVLGGDLYALEGDVLAVDMTALDASTLTIEGNISLSVGDILRIKSATNDEWLEVTSVIGAGEYGVNRDKAGVYAVDTNPAWTAGAAVLNYGQATEGGVRIFGGVNPLISLFTHAGSPWTTISDHALLTPSITKFGSDVGNVATTALAVLHEAQTYGGEALGASDVVVGNLAGSNMLWDQSAGQLKFRGGTTTKLYLDTDGTLYAGGGDIWLDETGITLKTGLNNTNQIKWNNGTNDRVTMGFDHASAYGWLRNNSAYGSAEFHIEMLEHLGMWAGASFHIGHNQSPFATEPAIGFRVGNDEGPTLYNEIWIVKDKTVFNYGWADVDFQIRGAFANGLLLDADRGNHAIGIAGNHEAGLALRVHGKFLADGNLPVGHNLLKNGGFQYDLHFADHDGWSFSDPNSLIDTGGGYPSVWHDDNGWVLQDGEYVWHTQEGSTLAVHINGAFVSGQHFEINSDRVPVIPGEYYTAHGLFAAHRQGGEQIVYLKWYDSSDTYIGASALKKDGTGSTAYTASGGPSPDNFDHMIATAQMPSNARFARIGIRACGYAPGETDAWLFADHVKLERGRTWTPYAPSEVELRYDERSWVMTSPEVGGFVGPRIPEGWYVNRVDAYCVGGTSVTFNIEERSTIAAAGTNLIGSDIAADTDGVIQTSFANALLDAGNWLWLDISAISGNVEQLVVTLTFARRER